MEKYIVVAYPIVAVKPSKPVEAADPTAAILAVTNHINWYGLLDRETASVEYAQFTDGFECFNVREVGREDEVSLYYCADGETLLPPDFSGDIAQSFPKVLALLQQARDRLRGDPGAAGLVQEIEAVIGGPRERPARPTIVCLCGSTRFWRTFQEAGLQETLAGKIVLSIGAASGTDDDHFGNLPPIKYAAVKAQLDELHLRKIEVADEVLILNLGGYIGESTRRELDYARSLGKRVRFWEEV